MMGNKLSFMISLNIVFMSMYHAFRVKLLKLDEVLVNMILQIFFLLHTVQCL